MFVNCSTDVRIHDLVADSAPCKTIQIAIEMIDETYYKLVKAIQKMGELQILQFGTHDEHYINLKDQAFVLNDLCKYISRYLDLNYTVGLDDFLFEMEYDLQNGISK